MIHKRKTVKIVQFIAFLIAIIYWFSKHETTVKYNITYKINSNICLYSKPKILIIITSHAKNLKTRAVIRRSYPRDIFAKYNVQIVFLLAEYHQDEHLIQSEYKSYNDIVQGTFVEAYRNLTYKHLMGLQWSRDHCPSAEYVVKMDDDIAVNYYKLFDIIGKTDFNITGHIIENTKPIRSLDNKWYVSKKEYSKEMYPAFLSGWLYVATAQTVRQILHQLKNVEFFWIDDVFVTGILREMAQIDLVDIKQYYRYEPRNIECCILNKYSCDFLAAPTGNNFMLHKTFSSHLWKCRYKKICLLQSSKQQSCIFNTKSDINERITYIEKIKI